jgi:hypothetical protein
MSLLTDQAQVSGVSLTDFIHVVVTGDTSQNPAGSSFKATIQQVFDSYTDIFVTGGTYSNGTATFENTTGGTFNVSGFFTGGTIQFSTTGVSSDSILTWDYNFYGVNTTAGPVTLTLPSTSGKDGQIIVLKDEAGDCNVKPIIIDPTPSTIDGQSSVQMNINFMSLTLLVRNNKWFII